MDDQAWADRHGLPKEARHRRLSQMWNPWEDEPAQGGLEYTDSEEHGVTLTMTVQQLGRIVFRETKGFGKDVDNDCVVSLKGLKNG